VQSNLVSVATPTRARDTHTHTHTHTRTMHAHMRMDTHFRARLCTDEAGISPLNTMFACTLPIYHFLLPPTQRREIEFRFAVHTCI